MAAVDDEFTPLDLIEATDELAELPEELAGVAQSDLNEDAETRVQMLEELRNVLLSHELAGELDIRTDYKFLLMFARARKFRLEEAAENVINYYKFARKMGWDEAVGMDEYRDALEAGAIWVVGKDAEGRTMIALQGAFFETSRVPIASFQRALYFLLHLCIRDDATQIRGFVIVQDMGGMGLDAASFERNGAKVGFEMMSKNFPARMKGFYVINQPWFVSGLFKVAKPFVSSKISSRVHMLGSDKAKLVEVFGAEHLPAAYYGGSKAFNWIDHVASIYEEVGAEYDAPNVMVGEAEPSPTPREFGIDVVQLFGRVSVSGVDAGSLGEALGLRVGDIIETVNGAPVRLLKHLKIKKNVTRFVVSFVRPTPAQKAARDEVIAREFGTADDADGGGASDDGMAPDDDDGGVSGGGVSDDGGVSGGGGVSDDGGVSGGGGVSDDGSVSGGGGVSDDGGVSGGGGVSDDGGVSGGGGGDEASDNSVDSRDDVGTADEDAYSEDAENPFE